MELPSFPICLLQMTQIPFFAIFDALPYMTRVIEFVDAQLKYI